MSNWRDAILDHFVPNVSRLTLVADPDSLMTEESSSNGPPIVCHLSADLSPGLWENFPSGRTKIRTWDLVVISDAL